MEGVIKFRCFWEKEPLAVLSDEELQAFNHWRSILIRRGVIGSDVNGLGFGNISIRLKDEDNFIITGSQTGHLQLLSHNDLSLVTESSVTDNFIKCRGMIKASSEALTHSVVYRSSTRYRAVIHFHSKSVWKNAQGSFHLSDPEAAFGTPELALSVERILNDLTPAEPSVIIMGGHPDGVITFGSSLEEAAEEAVRLLDKFSRS